MEDLKKYFKKFFTQGQILSLNHIFELSNIDDIIKSLFKNWYQEIVEHQYLNTLIQKDVDEIKIHTKTCIYLDNENIIDSEYEHNDLQTMFEVICFKNKINWNYKNPFVSFRLEVNGKNLRVSLIHPSITTNKEIKAVIRIFKNQTFKLDQFQLPLEQIQWLKEQIKNKKNIMISGSTCSGKTSFLQSLSQYFSLHEHLVILEDTHELNSLVKNCTHLVASESIYSNLELKDYLPFILRISPQRILLGEIRSAEVIPLILAMNTGHTGIMSTIHANSAIETCHRLVTLFCLYANNDQLSSHQVGNLIAQNIDYIIHLDNKSVSEIIKINGHHQNKFSFEQIFNFSTNSAKIYT